MSLRVHLRQAPTRASILLLIGGALIALTALGLTVRVPGELEIASRSRLDFFVAVASASGLLYLAATALVLRGPAQRRLLWIVLIVAGIARLLVLPPAPFLSTDIYRYVWDGRVQGAGINPYRYVPGAPELASLRDAELFPKINRAHYAPTVYPPVAQAVFFLVTEISPTVLAMKSAMVLCEAVAIAAVIKLLGILGLPRERVLIYAWNPLAIWEFAGNGHVDAVAIGLIALALLARARGRMALTGAALGAAILVKFLPAVLLPAFWRRWDIKLPAAGTAVIAAFYLLYVGVGWKVLGFLPRYGAEEGYRAGDGFYYLLALRHIAVAPAVSLYLAAVVALFAALAFWMVFLREPQRDPGSDTLAVAQNALILAAILMVTITPHYAWYYAWLALPACLYPSLSVLYLTLASFLLYFDPGHETLLWPGMLYGPFLVLALAELWWRRKGDMIPLPRTLGRSP
ncbi:MAG: glycosyltransferase 87 family protein [Alphaproteobacteria bacterium]